MFSVALHISFPLGIDAATAKSVPHPSTVLCLFPRDREGILNYINLDFLQRN